MFEAGALCKGDDQNRVNILLAGVEPEEIRTPLYDFNMVRLNENDLKKLIKNLFKRSHEEEPNPKDKIDESEIDEVFDKWYPDFKDRIDEIMKKYPDDTPWEEKTEAEKAQDELLATVRRIENVVCDIKRQVAINNPGAFLERLSDREDSTDEQRVKKDAIMNRVMVKYIEDKIKAAYK